MTLLARLRHHFIARHRLREIASLTAGAWFKTLK